MAEANERIITDDTGKEILEAIRKIPGVTGATSIDHGGTGATTAEEALRNLGAQPKINVENVEEELGKMVKSVNSMTPDEHGNVHIAHVKTAENLTSDDAQDIYGEFIERTTGGTASITDGKSWIGIMEGNSVRTGYVSEDKSVNVVNMPREPITASIDWNAFRTAIDSATANILFSYNGTAWNNDLADYGITVVGYPIAGDSISVSFTEKSESYEVLSDGGITINVNWSTFESKYATDPILYFTYSSGTWSADLAEYGIVVTGTPIDGDVINVQYVPEVRNMYVNPISRGEAINAYVNWDTFRTAVSGSASTVTLLYTTEWSEPLSTYGVSISGSPIKGDQIELYFTPEVRGQIVNSTPTKFVSTGWNLYDNAKGYARVLKYSETYGFIISGTYTSISFSETVDGATSAIAVDSDGNFDIPSDGYVHVIGGNASDTAIYMTWSDWTDGTPLTWSAYYESAINLSSLMQATFPFGLCSVGSASDDIDFSNKIATSRIERMEYNSTNLALARNSGREYAYDENYIYAVKEIPTSVGFSLDYELDAFDHGLERVEGTSVPVFIHMLYGQNLRDKLRTDVVTISQQNLTSAQKQQIRENLGLGGSAQLPIANGGTGAVDAAGARSNLGLGSAALKSVSASIAYGDLNLPTSNAVYNKIGNVGDVDLQSQISTLNNDFTSKFGRNYGNSATPITNLDDLPINSVGLVVLASTISPNGSLATYSFIKSGAANTNRYNVIVKRIYNSIGNEDIYFGSVYDETFLGWQKIALNDNINRRNIQKSVYSQLGDSGNASSSTLTAYPTTTGVFRVGPPSNCPGLPSGSNGYGPLLIFDAGGYVLHIHRAINHKMWYGSSGNNPISAPENWVEIALKNDIDGIKNAKDLGSASSLSTLQTLLATEAALMPTNGVEPIEVYCNPVFETFKTARYIGQLCTNFNNGTRVDFTVTLTSGNGNAITIARLNGAWSYIDLNANLKIHENQKEWSTNTTTLSEICTYAENLVGEKSGTYYIGYTNTTASVAVGLPSGAYFIILNKHNADRMALEFINIENGKRCHLAKVNSWSTNIIVIDS